ncbi:hypothetical protein L7F22_034203 [Adiantum nelumboides]|nr:hypothetical protein [Adiantum nelumboides]
MAKGVTKEEMAKIDDKFHTAIKENKKLVDSTINTIINRLSKLEKEVEALHKEKEEWTKEKETKEQEHKKETEKWKGAQEEWRKEKEKEEMQEQMAILKAFIASLTPKKGEINNETKEAIKEELTKALTERLENKLEATKEGWVEVWPLAHLFIEDGARTSGQQLRVPEHVLLDEGLAEAVERIWEAALASEEDVASQCAAGISELSRSIGERALNFLKRDHFVARLCLPLKDKVKARFPVTFETARDVARLKERKLSLDAKGKAKVEEEEVSLPKGKGKEKKQEEVDAMPIKRARQEEIVDSEADTRRKTKESAESSMKKTKLRLTIKDFALGEFSQPYDLVDDVSMQGPKISWPQLLYLSPKIDFEEQNQQFCAGLPEDINEYVNSQRPKTISAVIHHTTVAARINFQQGAKRNLKPMEIKEKHEHKGKNQPQNSSKGNSSNNKAKEKGVYKGNNRLTPEELECYRKDNRCFKCGEQGHAYRACPQRNARNEQPRASIIDAPKEDVHCKGSPLSFAWGKVREHDAFILFDPGSTHNFIFHELAAKLGIQEFEMGDAMKADGAFIGQEASITPLIGKLRLHIQGYVDK